MSARLRSTVAAALCLLSGVHACAQELATNVRIGVNSQAIFVSADFPSPIGSIVVRMTERAGRLTALHLIQTQGTVVVVPPPLIDGLVASTHVELAWYVGADEKIHASIQIPCLGWSDKQPSLQACKKTFILIDGQLKRVISHLPSEGGTTITYTSIP